MKPTFPASTAPSLLPKLSQSAKDEDSRRPGRPTIHPRPTDCQHQDREEHQRGVCYKCSRNGVMRKRREIFRIFSESHSSLNRTTLLAECTAKPEAFAALFGVPLSLFEAWFACLGNALTLIPSPPTYGSHATHVSSTGTKVQVVEKLMSNRDRLAVALFAARSRLPACAIAVLFRLPEDVIKHYANATQAFIEQHLPVAYFPSAAVVLEILRKLGSPVFGYLHCCDSPRLGSFEWNESGQMSNPSELTRRTLLLLDAQGAVIGWETNLPASFDDYTLWKSSAMRQWLAVITQQTGGLVLGPFASDPLLAHPSSSHLGIPIMSSAPLLPSFQPIDDSQPSEEKEAQQTIEPLPASSAIATASCVHSKSLDPFFAVSYDGRVMERKEEQASLEDFEAASSLASIEVSLHLEHIH